MKNSLFILFILFAKLSFSQDTVVLKYRSVINYAHYSKMPTPQQRINNSFIKVVDMRGNIRFVGQVFSDCGGSYAGDTKEFYRNGKVKAIRKYIVGKGCPCKNGIWTYYKKDGTIKKTVSYNCNNKITETNYP